MKCKNCGAEVSANDKFCGACGAAVEAETVVSETVQFDETESVHVVTDEPNKDTYEDTVQSTTETNQDAADEAQAPKRDAQTQETQTNPDSEAKSEPVVPEEYKPITMWGYFGYELLFSLPLVGLICIIIFSFGGTKNKNLQAFARSRFCWAIIGFVFAAIIAVMILVIGLRFRY